MHLCRRPHSVVVITIIAVFLLQAGCTRSEEKIADHLENMTIVLEDNMDKPKTGAVELRAYLRANLPELLRLSGELLVELDELSDEDELEERLDEIFETLEEPLIALGATLERFSEKAAADQEASAYLEEISEQYTELFPLIAPDAFERYTQQSKSLEAVLTVDRLCEAAVAYYEEERVNEKGEILEPRYPKQTAANVTHSDGIPGKSPAPADVDWNDQLWRDLSFSLEEPSHYRYTYLSGGVGTRAWFKVIGEGDLDGDGISSRFECHGTVSSGGWPEVSGVLRFDEDE